MSAAAEQHVHRVKAAIAEAGYPDASVYLAEYEGRRAIRSDAPYAVMWTALLVCGLARACWPCWSVHLGYTTPADAGRCEHDPWTSERPVLGRVS